MRTENFTRLLSLLLSLTMAFSVIAPVTASATGTETTDGSSEGIALDDGMTVDETVEIGVGDDVTLNEDNLEQTTEDDVALNEDDLDQTAEDDVVLSDTGNEGVVDGEVTVDTLTTDSSEQDGDDINALASDIQVTNYATFLELFKILEGYAIDFAAANQPNDPVTLVLNYIRTGVEKYTDDNWTTLAGPEKTEFRDYVTEMDALNGTTAAALKNLNNFEIPNGQTVEFDHMFGTMNIAYFNPGGEGIGGWAGDLCDLLNSVKVHGGVTGTLDEMVTEIRESHLGFESGIEGVSSFGQLDIYGDLDAYYFVTTIKTDGGKLSTLFENYFTASLTDEDRAAFFLNNRFNGLLTREEVREAIYSSYASDVSIQILEAKRGIEKVADDELRKACCYAFADYVFDLADGRLVANPDLPVDPDNPDDGDDGDDDGDGDETTFNYFNVFDSKESTLAPGITQTIKTARTADDKQIIYYIATVDINRSDVSIHANYNNNDPSQGWGMSKVVSQMAAAQERHSHIENYNTIVGVNADFFDMSNGKPTGALVMEGVTYNPAGREIFFAILDDGTPYIGDPSEWEAYKDRVVEAVGANAWLVKDGKSVVSYTEGYYLNRASRTCVGITADNQVVLMVLDGRQEPRSAGGSMQELAQIMLEAGCVTAVNLDGGGSTTFAAKQEGSDEVTVVNKPSDGFARSVSSSLLVVSTATISSEFYYAKITSEFDYVTVGTPVVMTATGVSGSGHSADIPANAYWQVSDPAMGSIDDGVFTALALGEVDVQLVVDGVVVGSKTMKAVVPDKLEFSSSFISAVFSVPVELPLTASYMNAPVAFNINDVMLGASNSNAGTFNGLYFTADEASGIRNVTLGAALSSDKNVYATILVNVFKADETTFDFDNATAGNKNLAWVRDIDNSMTSDNFTYYPLDPEKEMPISYTFALDMTEIGIPEKFKDLVYRLPAPDDGSEPTAWGYLLCLAERVSVLTEVKVEATFDADLDVDISELTVSNDYFEMKSAVLDPVTNTLTIICNWIDQTEAIAPSTANPLCILSGIKVKAKDGADWNEENLSIINTGVVTYDIYLRASSLYSFAQEPANQEQYGLIPFENTEVIIGGSTEKGAHYADQYTTFVDAYVLNNGVLQGWHQVGDFMHYYVDHVPLKDGIYKLPGFTEEDRNTELYYRFDENGGCIGAVTGMFELGGNKYYAFDGKLLTGWQEFDGAEGGSETYYFDPVTGAAVDGTQVIDGYTYVFENYILIRGQFITDSKGIRYIWAGEFPSRKWVTVDGKEYYSEANGYLATGIRTFPEEGVAVFYLFDETGAWMKDYTGFYEISAKVHDYLYAGTCWIVEGKAATAYKGEDDLMHPYGLILVDGDYYYISIRGVIAKGTTTYVDATNGLMSKGSYTFDNDGKMLNTNVKNIYFYSDGELYEAYSIAAGGVITAPKAPAKEGYTFKGWSYNGKDVITLPDKISNSDITVYAVWEIGKFTITFDTLGGSEVDAITAEYGAAVKAPADPTKVGFSFEGWDALPTTMPASDITVKAIWKANEYTITFEDGYGNKLSTLTQEYGSTINADDIAEPVSTLVGYTFDAWNPEIPATMPAENMTIVAKWKLATYTITFDTVGGTEIAPITAAYGSPVVRPANPTKAGYRFGGWDKAIPTVMTGDLVITAKWNPLPFTITFNTDGGTEIAPITQNCGTEVTAPADPTKTGYTFAGWDKEIPATIPAENITVTATWTINQYTITFDTDGGSAVDSVTADFGDTVTAPEAPTKTGYTFAGWENLPETIPAENVTVKALWTANKYTIKFNSNGGSEVADITDDFGSAVTAPAAPTKEGYTFAGWDKEIPATIPAEDITLTATWTINQYIITFDTDGGSAVESITQNYGTAINAPAAPTKEGSNFGGWSPELPDTMPAENITVKAIWNIGKYTIVFNTDGGTKINSITADFGTAVTKPADPTKEGYEFIGWDKEIPATMPDEYLEIKALWKVKQYTITFDTDGGSEVKAITQDFGTAVTAPEAPTKTGYTFAGWDTEIPETMHAENITVKATWKINQYTISFAETGDTAVDAITADFGTAVTKPADPTKVGYTFTGWDKEVPSTMPAEDVTITAQWTINKYTITFETDGGSEVAAITADFGEAVNKPSNPIRIGYSFAGWVDDNGTPVTVPETMPAENITLTAKWNIIRYTIRFNTNGGSAIADIYATYGSKVTPPADPTKTGYTFAGWDREIPETMPAKNTVINAKWTINKYTIKFDTDGGSAVADITADFGSAITAPEAPTKTGHTFAGWDIEVPSTMPAEDMTIKALWTANKYTITFDTNGGTAIEPITLGCGTIVIIPSAPTKAGYTFAGWDKKIPETMPAENVTITAKWTINQYTITFDTDGGSEVKAITQDFGTAVTAPEAPTKTGYTFAGWDKEIPATIPAEDMTIKALWTANKYTIKFDTDGGSAIADITADFGTAVTAPEAPTKDGYTFIGWDVEVPSTMPAENLVITAVWEYTYTGWLEESGEITYLVNGEKAYADELVTIEDEKYYFDEQGYVVKGVAEVEDTTYIFNAETGALCEDINGLYDIEDDTYYVENGAVVKYAGVVKVGNAYYYFGEDNKAVKGGTYNVVKTNDLVEAGEYEFEADGKMIYKTYLVGDFDDNGVVDNNDAIYLLYAVVFGEGDYPLNQSGDFDKNGIVDNNDAIYLLYHVVFGAADYPIE